MEINLVCQKNMCNGCMACLDICPKKCIKIVDDIFSYNAIKNVDDCINCSACEKVCPNNNAVQLFPSIEWYQGWSKEEIRINSSSGGAAMDIAINFIKNGGYVASCKFNQGNFIFSITNNLEEVKKFAGSKYVKSNPEGIYKQIQEKLKTHKVLFIGLPCQVAGLKNYIKKQINLYTIDLICHGTPSPKILNRYLEESGYEINKLENISFRKNNIFGISSKSINDLEKGTDCYLISFLNSINYTENCYSCKYARKERVSDLTLGDSWGTDLKYEENKGISLILIQNLKGSELLANSTLKLYEVNYEVAVKSNHQLNHPSYLKSQRKDFLTDVKNGKNIKKSVKRLLPKEIVKQRLKYQLIKFGLFKKVGKFK